MAAEKMKVARMAPLIPKEMVQAEAPKAPDILAPALAAPALAAPALAARGHALRGQGRESEAIDAYRMAIEADPDDAETMYQLGATLLAAGRIAEVEEVADRLKTLKPDLHRGHALAGLALRARGRLTEALPHLERALSLSPRDVPTLNAVMMTLHSLGRIEEARVHGLAALVYKDLDASAKAGTGKLGLNLKPRGKDAKGRLKDVIAFSLWGDHPDYTHGAIINAGIAPHIYMGWTCRFYCDATVPEAVIRELKRLGAEVVTMPEPSRGGNGTFWRFLASDDAGVGRFVCRDCDSRLNLREKVAVDEWMASGRPFHVMRDHIYHNELILAGMWGGISGVLPNLQSMAAKGFSSSGLRHADQNFLRLAVWPMIRDHVLVHDSQYRFRGSVDFPAHTSLSGSRHVGWGEKKMKPWSPS